jgi:hypothetical protein
MGQARAGYPPVSLRLWVGCLAASSSKGSVTAWDCLPACWLAQLAEELENRSYLSAGSVASRPSIATLPPVYHGVARPTDFEVDSLVSAENSDKARLQGMNNGPAIRRSLALGGPVRAASLYSPAACGSLQGHSG